MENSKFPKIDFFFYYFFLGGGQFRGKGKLIDTAEPEK